MVLNLSIEQVQCQTFFHGLYLRTPLTANRRGEVGRKREAIKKRGGRNKYWDRGREQN
jgi:hypothetical protein